MTKAKIPLAGVVGSPIAHSKSPKLQSHWLNTYGIAGYYVPMDVAPEDFERVIRALPKAGFVGVNVTIPHKERAISMADIVSDTAAKIGAANTLIFHADGKIEADNTDGYGFIANLKQGAPKWQACDGPAMVFGAGGAARAIVYSLLQEGAPEIILTNRTYARAKALQKEFGVRVTLVDWDAAPSHVSRATTVVNTTSLGMTGNPAFNVPLNDLQPQAVVTDIVYSPLRTEFLKTAEAAGCVTVNGLGMLLHQAVPGFERWFGQKPEVNEALRALVLA